MNRLVAVGTVSAAHGVRGELKVKPLSGDPGRFKDLKTVFMQRQGLEPRQVEVTGARPAGTHVLVTIEGVADRDAAAALKGASLLTPEEELPPAGENEFYYFQLEGLRVESLSGTQIGTLDYVGKTGGNDVYFIRTPQGDHRLAPAIKSCIREVDLERGLMVVDEDWIT